MAMCADLYEEYPHFRRKEVENQRHTLCFEEHRIAKPF